MNKPIDFPALKSIALQQFDQIMDWLGLAGEYQGSEFVCLNPKRQDREPGSFKINSETGLWCDFAESDARGSDLISLVAYIHNCSQSDAAYMISGFLRDMQMPISQKAAVEMVPVSPTGWTTPEYEPSPSTSSRPNEKQQLVKPVPDDAPAMPRTFGPLGQPSMTFTYRNAEGLVLCHILRFDLANGRKDIRPLTLWAGPNGRLHWKLKGFSKPFPLYNQHLLAERPDAPVLIVEGEKAADAAALLFPDHVVTTTMHGAKSVEQADLQPLIGRSIFIWPDHDQAGREYAETLTELVRNISKRSPLLVMQTIDHRPAYDADQQPILESGFEPENGWDAADAVAMGWTADHIKLLADEVWEEVPADHGEYLAKGTYYVDQHGVYSVQKTHESGKEYKTLICSPLHIKALSRDQSNLNWGIVLEFQDADGINHRWSMPKELLASGSSYRQALLNMGLDINASTGNPDPLATYIQSIKPSARALSVTKPGWHKKVFVFPDKVLGMDQESVVLNTNDPQNTAIFKQHGSIQEWQAEVAALCEGNSRLVLSVCVALSGPFLYHLGIENGGFHIYGASSTGKTTAGMVAASVWGNHTFIGTWRTTGNALESVASRHNDTLLILDELSQVDPRDAGAIAYMLGNGLGKGRANRNGIAREISTWRLIFLSNGEITLADHISGAGGRVTAGQEVRIINLPSDGGAGMGLFENLHGSESPQLFSARIKQQTGEYYGFAGPAIVSLLVEQDDLKPFLTSVNRAIEQFVSDNVPSNASGQVYRVAKRFGLLATVGEIAIEHGILPWPPGEAITGVRTCLQSWMDARGGIEETEAEQAVAAVRHFLELHGESRFTQWLVGIDNNGAGNTINRAGFRKTTDDDRTMFYVLPEVWRTEVCQGLNPRQVARIMLDRSFLIPGTDGRATQSVRLPGLGETKRVYVISPDILGSAMTVTRP